LAWLHCNTSGDGKSGRGGTNVPPSVFPLPVWQLGIRERTTRLHPVPREEKHVAMVQPAARRAQRGPRPARGAEVTWRRSVTRGVPAADLKGERERTRKSPPRPLGCERLSPSRSAAQRALAIHDSFSRFTNCRDPTSPLREE
jgi:hypothetical protein